MNHRLFLAVFLGPLACVGALADDGGWQFQLSPYIWLAGIDGRMGTIPGQPPVDIDYSASDAFDDTEASFMLFLDARKGRQGFVMDALYSDVRSDFELLPDPINLSVRSISETTIISAAYQYEMYRGPGTVIDLMGGVRYWDIDSTLKFTGGLGVLAGQSVSNTESWFDPALGIKAITPLGGSNFYFMGAASVGGFGVGSDLFYDLTGNLGYQWNDAIGTSLGYRLFDVDYEDGGYVYDVTQEGWQLALTWGF